jgi:polysaccharide biosynthesis protein PslH
LRLARMLAAAIARRRSLVHTRFAPPALVDAIADADADLLVARRLYMAQAAIDAGPRAPTGELVAIADVLESEVLRRRRSIARPLLAIEARRTRRDELRCARAATAVACVSDVEIATLAPELDGPPGRLDLILPPAATAAPLDEPVALFVGDLHWPPNREGVAELERLWPEVRAAAPSARLLIAGRHTDQPGRADQPGVERLGFVADLDPVWNRASVLIVPVAIGGGVRVKILDAARRGVPVVASVEAVGSIPGYLPVTGSGSPTELVARTAELLGDPPARRAAGEALFEANRKLAGEGFVESQVSDLLRR